MAFSATTMQMQLSANDSSRLTVLGMGVFTLILMGWVMGRVYRDYILWRDGYDGNEHCATCVLRGAGFRGFLRYYFYPTCSRNIKRLASRVRESGRTAKEHKRDREESG